MSIFEDISDIMNVNIKIEDNYSIEKNFEISLRAEINYKLSKTLFQMGEVTESLKLTEKLLPEKISEEIKTDCT